MESYTYASDEACEAICHALPEKYAMALNRSDMRALVTALQASWERGNEWSGEFLSSIAQTLDIEFV